MSSIPQDDFSQFLGEKDFFDYKSNDVLQRSFLVNQAQATEESQQDAGISDYLVAFSTQPQTYCVGCVDMVNSTKISASIPSSKISSYYEMFLNSMSKIIGKFHGQVIKNVGDCLMYYFPSKYVMDGFRNCLNCGLAMIEAQSVICNQLQKNALPFLSYRISADYGNVIVMSTTDSNSIDMIGPPVNMCTKINHHAKSNQFVIGGDFYEMVKKLPRFKFKQIDSCSVGFKVPYPVYRVIS